MSSKLGRVLLEAREACRANPKSRHAWRMAAQINECLADFIGKHWVITYETDRGGAVTQQIRTGEFMLVAASGVPIDIVGGPYEDARQSRACLRRYRRAAARAQVSLLPVGEVSTGGDITTPLRCPRGARHVCTLAWHAGHGNPYKVRYQISTNETRGLWGMWLQKYMYADAAWKTICDVRIRRVGMSREQAAIAMLTYLLRDEAEEDMKRFSVVVAEGLLKASQIEDIGDQVWKDLP